MSNERILRLPDEAIKNIRAGQVIADKLDIVKELLDNALDAGATKIRLDLSRNSLVMSDNGRGIERTDSAAVCKSKRLTAKIWAKYGPVKHAPREDLWVKEKKDVDAALHRERTNRRSRMVDKARKRHFRNADTDTLEARFADTAISASAKDAELTRPLKYNIPERDVVIRLTCEPVTDLTDLEKHVRSIEAIKARAALCRRQESQRRGRPRSTFKPKELMNPPEGLGVRVRANFRVGVEVKDAGVKVEVKGLYKGATCRSEQATILIKV